MKAIPSGSTAVMARRVEPPDSLDFFPTPPWATRALCELVLPQFAVRGPADLTVWEPAAGEGHMAEVLRESFGAVIASDVHDYGRGYAVGSFVGDGPDRMAAPAGVDWIITNPPFNLSIDFARRAIAEARYGCALLVRTAWLESGERWQLFCRTPPTHVAVFMGRVAMVRGRFDPGASSATSYSWVVWNHPVGAGTRLLFIPPDARQRLTRQDDVARFAPAADAGPLFALDGAAVDGPGGG